MEQPAKRILLSFFKAAQLQSEQQANFLNLWKEYTFKQNELITEAGRIEKYFYVVLEGVQAIYLLNQKGDKVVLGFSYTGSPSGIFDSFLHQKPADTFLEALKPFRQIPGPKP